MHREAAYGEFPVPADSGEVTSSRLDQITPGHQPGEQDFQFLPARTASTQLSNQLFVIGLAMRQPRNVLQKGSFAHPRALPFLGAAIVIYSMVPATQELAATWRVYCSS